MYMLKCEDVGFSYEGKPVSKNINFTVEPGDYLFIVGENGSGKSTLMKGLLGLKKPAEGHILYGDNLKKNEIGYLPQQTQVQKDFPASVWEVVLSGCLNQMGGKPFYTAKEKKRALDNMARLEILDLKKSCYRELSGGQQQRVLLARALCATRQLLLLDEPVSGLDPNVTAAFYDLLKGLNEEGLTIIMISHDIPMARVHAKHVFHMENENNFWGSAEEFKKRF